MHLLVHKNHQKGEFDLDEAVSNFFQYNNSKKLSSAKHTPLDIKSAVYNENLIQEKIERKKY